MKSRQLLFILTAALGIAVSGVVIAACTSEPDDAAAGDDDDALAGGDDDDDATASGDDDDAATDDDATGGAQDDDTGDDDAGGGGPGPVGGCISDDDCKGGRVCINGACTTVTAGDDDVVGGDDNTVNPNVCDPVCGPDQTCKNGVCEDNPPPTPTCADTAQHDQPQGAACECDEQCTAETGWCGRNIVREIQGQDYCTKAECVDDFECAEGYGCLIVPDVAAGQLGVGSFCERCKNPTSQQVAEGDDCICNRDCMDTMTCAQGKCRYTNCDPNDVAGTCPPNHECHTSTDFLGGGQQTTACAKCADTPATVAMGGKCECNGDCAPVDQQEVACVNNACAITNCVKDPDSCPDGFKCSADTDGNTACIPGQKLQCAVGDGSRGIGQRCGCNADCAPEAPDCVLFEAPTNIPFIGGQVCSLCSVANCTVGDPNACPPGGSNISCQDFSQYAPLPPFCGPDIMGMLNICGPIQ